MRNIKKTVTWIVVPLMLAIFVLDIATVAIGNSYCKKIDIQHEDFSNKNGTDRIHFLNVANSDMILLESKGHFALIDAGEGNNNPRRSTDYKGYEEEGLAYLQKVASDSSDIIHLDFILATHYHYDHIGGFHSLITNENVEIGKAYFKDFNYNVVHEYETKKWKIDETYEQLIDDLSERNVEIISDIPTQIAFGNFKLDLFNTVTPKELVDEGENASSIGIKVTKGERTAFLAADITKSTGLEAILKDEIGHVDLLKIGHHGYFGSSSQSFLKALSPKVAIVTNQLGKVYPNVKWNLTMCAKVPFFATYDSNGIIATFTDDNRIVFTDCIQ